MRSESLLFVVAVASDWGDFKEGETSCPVSHMLSFARVRDEPFYEVCLGRLKL
jgi:hypothetical protein